MTENETKRVTRAELAEAIGDQHWGWLADTNNPRALRAVADAIFDALPADPPASAGHNHAGDFCDPLTCPWRPTSAPLTDEQWDAVRMEADPVAALVRQPKPASADVDAAREALLSIWLNERQRQAQAEAVARFEAAVRADGLDVDDVRAVLDAYGMQANRRWQGEIVKAGDAARDRLLARLAEAER